MTRLYQVYPERNIDGSYRMQENFHERHVHHDCGSEPGEL